MRGVCQEWSYWLEYTASPYRGGFDRQKKKLPKAGLVLALNLET